MRRLALVAAGAACGLVLAPPALGAGQYLQYLGTLPSGAPAPAGPWQDVGIHGGLNHGTRAGGAFGVQLPADAGLGHEQRTVLAAPPNLSFSSAWVDRYLGAPVSWALAQPQIQTTWENRGSWGGGYGGDADDGPVLAGAAPGLSIAVRCASTVGGFDPSPRCTGGGYWIARRIELIVADATAPSGGLDGDGGALLAGGWLTGESASARMVASDTGSGVYRFVLRSGAASARAPADPDSPTCRDIRPGIGVDHEFAASATSLVPCRTASTTYAPAFDLRDLGDGVHAGAQLVVEDASGRETVVVSGVTLRVNAPGGALADPGTPCPNGTTGDAGECVKRPPSNSAAPQVTGTARVGATLAYERGTWADVDGVTWSARWQRCSAGGGGCTDIPGATGDTLAVGSELAGATVRVLLTATTDGGETTVASPVSAQVTLGDGTMPSPGGAGGAGGVRDAPVRTETGGGGGGGGGALSRDQVRRLPVPPHPARAVSVSALNGVNAGAGARLRMAGSGAARIVLGQRRELAGVLENAAGEPIGDAQVDVIVHRHVRGAEGEIAGAVRTDAAGRFRFVLPPGPSRIVTFGYRVHLSDRGYDRTVSTTVEVAAPVSLTASRTYVRNGEAVRFRGAVTGAPAGSRKTGRLEVRVGRSWRAVRTVSLDGRGRFATRYRFERTMRTQRYAFRVSVRRDASWPFADSASAPVTVTVLGRPS